MFSVCKKLSFCWNGTRGRSRRTSVWTGSVGSSLVFVQLDIKMATHVTKANCVQSEATLESCHSSSSSSDSVSDGRLAAEGLPGDRQDGEEGLVIPDRKSTRLNSSH